MSSNTNNRWLTIITLLLLTANIVTLALLWTNKKTDREHFNPPPPQQQQGGGQVFEFLSRELKLDSAQQEIYKKLREEHQLQVRPLQDSIGRAKDSFFDLVKQENVTDLMVENSSNKIGNLEQQKDVFTFRHFQKLRAICNAAQKNKFDSIIQQALKQMAPPKGPGPGVGKEQRPGFEKRNDGTLPQSGIRPDGKRPPPPDGMRPAGDDRPPPPDDDIRPEGGPPPPGMRPGDRPLPPGMRPPPSNGGMRPPPGRRPGEPQKDTL